MPDGNAPHSLGEGRVGPADLGKIGAGTLLEPGVRVFGARFVHLGSGVYVGHDTFLRAYPDGALHIGDGCWIGPGCFINSFGGVVLGRRVGVGPGVKILTSVHRGTAPGIPILDTPLEAGPVEVHEGADLGTGAILLPGVIVGAFAQVGAGAVVCAPVEAGALVAGVPARPVRG